MITVRLTHKGQVVDATESTWQARMDELIAQLGPWVPGETRVEKIEAADPAPPPANSTWTELVVDEVAKARIEQQSAAIAAATGHTIDRSHQAYASGTRMADIGYSTQTDRRNAAAKLPLAVGELRRLDEVVTAEKRHERVIRARDFAKLLSINGKLAVDGYRVREAALRNLVARLESPSLRYVLGLRDRIADLDAEGKPAGIATPEQKAADKATLLRTLQDECDRFGDVELKLRLRDGVGDCFTIVSPTYSVADFPTARPIIERHLPDDARAVVTYDAISTRWEARIEAWTPTPVQLQAVGELFRAYGSVQSGDAGFDGYEGGSGFELLRCLNATTFLAVLAGASRRHVGNVTRDLPALIKAALSGVDAALKVWSAARADEIELPSKGESLIPLEVAVPGFYRAMLTARKGELVGVLPGRSEGHVVQLARHFHTERRIGDKVTRSDLAGGWTAYQQSYAPPVQRAAESAIGAWLSRKEPVGFVPA